MGRGLVSRAVRRFYAAAHRNTRGMGAFACYHRATDTAPSALEEDAMADNDPKKPPPDNYAENLGQRIRQNIHDEIDARMNYRQQRWQDRMDRRRERWSRRGMGGVGIHG